jgi:hypothetical protein
MVSGLQVFNDDNVFQIDQDYQGFAMKYKGTISMVVDPISRPNPIYIGSVTVSAINPIMAISSNAHCGIYSITSSGGYWTFNIRSSLYGLTSVDYWIFDVVSNVTITDTVGLEVFNASGTRVWHSSMKPLNIVDVITMDPIYPTWRGYSEAVEQIAESILPSGRAYAIVQGNQAVRLEQFTAEDYPFPPSFEGDKWMYIRSIQGSSKVVGNIIESGYTIFEDIAVESPISTADTGIGRGQGIFWAIDVTGY